MKNYFKKWNLTRLFRLALGILVLIQGVEISQWMLVVLGGLFMLMPLLNIGYCGTSVCQIPVRQNNQKKEEDAIEEVN